MTSGLEKCQAFIGCQLNAPAPHENTQMLIRRKPAITISRQTGSGGTLIAEKLRDYMQVRMPCKCGWTVFDKNLLEKVIEDHNLPDEFKRYIPEDRVSSIRDMMEEILGLHPPSATLVHQATETILHLADVGHVIILGRASNVVTRGMKNVFHVRLVAPLEKRLEYVMKSRNITSHDEAADIVEKGDAARKRYVKEYFKADNEDPMLYDMILNTGRLSHEKVAMLIGDAVLDWSLSL